MCRIFSKVAGLPVLIGLVLALSTGIAGTAKPAVAAEPPLALTWSQLIPPKAPRQLRSFLAGRTASGPVDLDDPRFAAHGADAGPIPPPQDDGRWMSKPSLTQRSTPPPVVESLNGKRVRIGGYVVPLDFDATRVKEFLLVPFVGACIHVPPPPANQIIYVTTEEGFEVRETFEPVYVMGKITTTGQHTGLAETGYTIAAERVETRE